MEIKTISNIYILFIYFSITLISTHMKVTLKH